MAVHTWREMSSKSQIEKPSLRASIVAMLLPWMYSMEAQNWPFDLARPVQDDNVLVREFACAFAFGDQALDKSPCALLPNV